MNCTYRRRRIPDLPAEAVRALDDEFAALERVADCVEEVIAGLETNLSVIDVTATNITVASDVGEDAILPAATDTTAGVMTAAQVVELGAAVPNTRQVLTANGLQGGGPLSADLTLSPVYGTAENTVCQGNDPRIGSGLQNVEEDLSPTLGGALRSHGFPIYLSDSIDAAQGIVEALPGGGIGIAETDVNGVWDGTRAALGLINGDARLAGTTTTVDNLKSDGFREVWATAEGVLYTVSPPLPGWEESDTDATGYTFTTAWTKLTGLEITTPSDIAIGERYDLTARLRIQNTGHDAGTILVASGLNGSPPTVTGETTVVASDFLGHVPVSGWGLAQSLIPAGTTVAVWIREAAGNSTQFDPVLVGDVAQPHTLTASVPAGGGATGATNLSTINVTASTLTIASDTGADAVVPAATTTTAGVVSYGAVVGTACQGNDSRLATNLGVSLITADGFTLTSSTGNSALLPAATVSLAGLMTAAQATALASTVPNTRAINTTEGLQGGGNLSLDRTIKPVYGTTINTVCMGNDTRLTASLRYLGNWAAGSYVLNDTVRTSRWLARANKATSQSPNPSTNGRKQIILDELSWAPYTAAWSEHGIQVKVVPAKQILVGVRIKTPNAGPINLALGINDTQYYTLFVSYYLEANRWTDLYFAPHVINAGDKLSLMVGSLTRYQVVDYFPVDDNVQGFIRAGWPILPGELTRTAFAVNGIYEDIATWPSDWDLLSGY